MLLRHAKSAGKDDPRLSDHERPLAPRGKRAAAAMGERLAVPDLVLCSTARRAVETWELARPGLGTEVEVAFEDRLYTFDEEVLLDRASELADSLGCVLLVGHNPAIEMLLFDLTGDDVGKFPTAALATLAFEGPWRSLGRSGARLESFVRPRDLQSSS
ncbi:MAG: histidine phosphatase family protein [Actinomycetota bacterium]|nr:histidine phosphatase family protein [Actinomycetota bacterium]